ncbi:hypothetical protein FQR65_LT13862 [Abscondita terminalis]|nr:hypothetical protein FQR65_LT13862 [Abscondita terminalis]
MALALTENDFDFYLRFAKPLVLNLSEPDDRVLAAAWIQKLRNEDVGDERLRTDYLKLLLFVLQRNKLIGTFATNPNTFEKLNEFPETQLKDIAKELLESEEEIRKKRLKEGGDNPPYATEHSGDLLEYAAAQEIPNFGVHAYYAISNDPLPFWDNTERAIFPRGAVSATDQSVCPSPALPVGESSSEPALQQRRVQFRSPEIPRKNLPRASPKRDVSEEERVPLTWGSNLIGVSEPAPHEYQPLVDDNVSDVFVTADTGTQMVEDFRHPVCSEELPPGGTQDVVGPDDFAPFDTMLEEYNKDEDTCATSKLSVPSRATHSRLPVCETGSRKSALRKPGESKISKPGTVICTTDADVFQIQPHIKSPYLSPFHQKQPDAFGKGAHYVQDLKSPEIKHIGDLPLSSPKRSLFSPTAREEQEHDFFLDGPPSFLVDSDFQSPEDSEELLKTPSPRKPLINEADYFSESLPHLTPPLQRYYDYGLPLKTSSPTSPRKPCGTPVYNEKMSLPTPRTQEMPRLLPEKDQIEYSLTPPGFEDFVITPCKKHDIFSSSQGDVSLPLESTSPKLSIVTQKLFSSVFPREDEFYLEDEPSFFDISAVGSGDKIDEQIAPPHYENELQPDLLHALGLTSDQMQAETHDPVERNYAFPVVTAATAAGQDIIDDFNKHHKEQAFTSRPKSKIAQLEAGILKSIPPPGSIVAQFKQQSRLQELQATRQLRRPLPGRSGIARPKSKLVPKPNIESFPSEQPLERVPSSPKITLEESKVFQAAAVNLQKRTFEQVSRVPPIQAIPSPVENFKTPLMQAEPTLRRSSEHPLKKFSTCSGRSPGQRTPSPCRKDFSNTGLDQELEFEPITPSRTRVELESSFKIGANENFTALNFESPPSDYHSPEFIVSSDDKFGLPKLLEIGRLPPVIFRSPSSELLPQKSPIAPTLAQETVQFPTTTRVLELASDYPPATTQTSERPRSSPIKTTGITGTISELTTESLPGKVSVQVENILKKLEDSFETQWTFSEISEHPSNVFEDSFQLVESPNLESPVTEFNFPSVDQIQADIDNILYQTPTLPSSPCRSPKKESPFFERLEESVFTRIDSEILPEEGYQSPRTPPGYQSPTEFFKQPPPVGSYQPPEYFGSPELMSSEVYRSPTKRPASCSPAKAVSYSPKSPIESPRKLRNRLRKAEYLTYGERNRVSVPPKISTVRELPNYYHEEDLPFLEKVESAQGKWKKKQKKLKIPKTSLDNVFESPVTIPTMFKVKDITGLQNEIKEYERKYPDLIDASQESLQTRRPNFGVNELSEFWDTPPNYKFKTKTPELVPICSPLSPCSPDRYIDEEEHLPESLHSPVALSAEELELFNVTKGISKAMEENIFQINRSKLPPVQNYTEDDGQSHILTSMAQLKEMGKRDPGDITAEQLPIYLIQSPPQSPELKTPPRRIPVRPAVSPSSPIMQYSTLLRPQISQFSPPESPTAFRCRMYTAGEPAYLSKPQMHVISGKTRANKVPVRKQLLTPKIETVIEETEGYDEEYVPFRAQVESSQKKFPKKRRRIRMPTSQMEDIRESPVRIPLYTEVCDPTGTMRERREVEKRLKNVLPEIEQEYPEHMFGISTSVPCGKSPKSILDITPPRDLPKPLRPEGKICGWETPPGYKLTPLQSAKPYRVSSPEEPQTLGGETIPIDIMFSPPHIPSTGTPPQQRTPSPITAKFGDLNIPSPPSGGLIFETIEIVDDQILDDELFPEELAVLSSTQKTPPSCTFPLQQFSPHSPPKSPVDLHILHAPEPSYLSKPFIDELVGSKKVRVKKRSGAPKVPLRENPLDDPNWMKLNDDKTGFKKIREEIESRYAYLPQLAKEYPQEMFDNTVVDEWNQQYTELDTDLPQTLPTPLQPTAKLDGWKTPPQYRQSPKQGVRTTDRIYIHFAHANTAIKIKTYFEQFGSQGISPLQKNTRSPVDYFEQLEKRISTEPTFLDSEIIVEDEEIFDLSSSKTPSPLRKIPTPCQKAKRPRLTENDKLLMKQVTRPEFENLMRVEEAVSSPPCRKTRPSKLTEADKLLLKQSTRSTFQELMEEEEGISAQPVTAEQQQTSGIQPQKPTKTKPPSERYEKIEELIYDIPDPGLPMPERTTEIQEFTLPPWSPSLPKPSPYVEDFDLDNVPDEILYYESPKEQKTSSKSTPTRTSPTTKQRPMWRNLFDEFEETEFLEEETLPDEQLVRSPFSPKTPPTPPRIEEYYDVVASPSPERSQSPRQQQTSNMSPCRAGLKSPENLTEQLRQHKYTDRRYDLDRDLMTKSVHIKNKRVPIRKSRPPAVCTIVETTEEGSNLPPRGALRKHKITEAKPIPSRFPAYVPQTLDFDSPSRGADQIVLTDTFTQLQPQHTIGISSVSPPKVMNYPEEIVEYEEVVEFPDFPEVEHIPQEYVYSPQSYQQEYGKSRRLRQNILAQDFASPNAVHGSSHVLRTCPGFPTRNVGTQSFALPMADYYGSPGRVHVRTPTWNRQRLSPRAAESVTVTEFQEPFDEFTSRCNPKVLGTCPIETVDDNVASGYQ